MLVYLIEDPYDSIQNSIYSLPGEGAQQNIEKNVLHESGQGFSNTITKKYYLTY